MEVADDQRRPTLGEDLRAAGNGAVLAVGPHRCSVASREPAVKSRFLASKSRLRPSRRSPPDVAMGRSTRGGAMTAPTRERIDRRTDTATSVEIAGFRGEVIVAQHPDYDTARTVWNGTVDRRPALIARCTGSADIAAAVRFARDRDLELAIRGGGHNVAGTAVCDGGIVIDLSAMRAVSVDPVERTARVQGGALW